MNRYENLCLKIGQVLKNEMPNDFSGLGAVIYRGEQANLPTCPLIHDSLITPPIADDLEIARLLVSLSRYSDIRHDGFHFIHQVDGLTSLSLFVSPLIPENYIPTHYGIGARHRSAELISRMGVIEAVVVVEKTGEIRVFINGQSRAI